jgi:hypothetical protein
MGAFFVTEGTKKRDAEIFLECGDKQRRKTSAAPLFLAVA